MHREEGWWYLVPVQAVQNCLVEKKSKFMKYPRQFCLHYTTTTLHDYILFFFFLLYITSHKYITLLHSASRLVYKICKFHHNKIKFPLTGGSALSSGPNGVHCSADSATGMLYCRHCHCPHYCYLQRSSLLPSTSASLSPADQLHQT